MPIKKTLGGCDCHVHVVAPLNEFPQSATRSYTAAPAPLDHLQALAVCEGASRFVLVQPSFYGTDNSYLLRALEKLGEDGRGVAAVDPNYVNSSLLKEFYDLGVRGLRVNLYSKSLQFAPERICDRIAATIEKLPSQNWHVELIAPLSLLLKAEEIVANSPVPVVLDHYALPDETSFTNDDGRRLLALASLPNVWLKLTAPYRVVWDPLATAPPADWLAAFLRVAPDRCVWGSDWPHTPPDGDQRGRDEPAPYRQIVYARVLRDFLAAVPDSALAQKVLVQNPSRLYGFSSH